MIPSNVIAIASFAPNSLQPPNAWVGHLPFAAWVIQEVSPKIFVELGTHSGNSYFSFCQSVVEAGISTKCYAVDTWQGDKHAGQYSEDIFAKVNEHHQEYYSRFSRLLRMTFDDAVTYFADESIELLHIDGLHTYEAVRHDFETWLPKLAAGAVVMFHDTNVRERNFGVWELWKELQVRYPNNLEFLHSHGLGVLQLNNAPEDKMLDWLQPNSTEKQRLINYFAALGSRQHERFELNELKQYAGNLKQGVAERDRQIVGLNQSVAERDGQIAILNQAVADRDGQLASLNQSVAERDGQIAILNQAVAERDGQIAEIYLSHSWRLTRPLRILRRLISRNQVFCSWRLIRNINAAVRGELRRHGLIGFFRRVSYYRRHFRTHLAFPASLPPAADGGLFNKEPKVPCDIRLHPDLSGIYEPIDASVSIVIPTLNAGPEFSWLLRKLGAQRGLLGLEIVIVDSGSHDGTVEIARAAGCNVVEIHPSDFSHSYARNTGADVASGDYLLFMVQDAYPIGDSWLYGILSYLLEHTDQKLVAVSCAEYSRSDSDIMYDSMINTHYRFLGCLDYDRIGKYQGDDHMSLRSWGQLSDVSCLISREIFARYRYRNDYAEDLDLGIRLIKDGYSVAMLASVKVVHSHDRPAYYYLKRSFVDVKFLVGMFDDFVYPHINSGRGLIAGIVSLAAHLTDWNAGLNELDTKRTLHDELNGWIQTWRRSFGELHLGKHSQLGDTPLDAYIDSLADRYLSSADEVLDKDGHHEVRWFLDAFFARLEHFEAFAGAVYGEQDAGLHKGLCDAVLKTFAATAGSALAFMCINLAQAVGGGEGEMAETITNELKKGI